MWANSSTSQYLTFGFLKTVLMISAITSIGLGLFLNIGSGECGSLAHKWMVDEWSSNSEDGLLIPSTTLSMTPTLQQLSSFFHLRTWYYEDGEGGGMERGITFHCSLLSLQEIPLERLRVGALFNRYWKSIRDIDTHFSSIRGDFWKKWWTKEWGNNERERQILYFPY